MSGWSTYRDTQRFVVVAFWGVETTVTFFTDKPSAIAAFENAQDDGADVFWARICKTRIVVEEES